MTGISLILQFVLAGVLCVFAVLSVQLLLLAYARLYRAAPRVRMPLLPDEALPRVLVQLPVCDEGPLAVRVAAAAARLDWPADKLEIQVLDDGRVENHDGLARALATVVPHGTNGVSFKVLRRGQREGFKAGNLAFGLTHSDAPYVAILDADFVPPTDFLKRMVPALVADQGLAYVQARWGHANRTKNWLTRVQGILLDAHFAVEQEGRFRAGLPMSFNGSAGVWNREAIDNAGGWKGDTLTEDLDLSMRCAMKGWRTAMLSDVEVPGELPETAAAWRAQQARWTKGHAQTAAKLLPPIWASTMPLWKKAAMSLQMLQFAFYTLAFFSAAISLTLMYMGVHYLQSVSLLGLIVTALGLATSASYLYLGQKMLGRERLPCILRSIALALVFPSGLILANTRATFEAFFSSHMNFQRTLRPGERYAGGWRGGPELVIGVLLPIFAFTQQAWSAPFFFFAVTGLVSIGVMGLYGSNAPQPVRELPPAE
ncbi:MAG TPA: glycosyltransferase family 2 protein [Rhizomicrobium sp.]|nr:glycosyltransferase family 2 protein [Rhizomicrobium sp.]